MTFAYLLDLGLALVLVIVAIALATFLGLRMKGDSHRS
jgi:hypothetical protein